VIALHYCCTIVFLEVSEFQQLPHGVIMPYYYYYCCGYYGLSSGYINWFHNYLTNRESCVCLSGLFSSPLVVLSGVPQGSVLGPLLFNSFINDLCNVISHSSCLLFADDLKVCRAIKSPNDCFLLQSDIERVHEWCSANLIKPNLSKIRVISFSRKTTVLNYQYRLGNSPILRTDCIKDLGVHIDSKLHFHQHVDFLCSHTMK
jgi:hypothetical protein